MWQNIAEFVSILIFIPCGVIFGYLIFYPHLQSELPDFSASNDDLYDQLQFWPFIVIIITSIIVAGEITITKLIKYKYNITHIYYICLSCFLFLASGICILCSGSENIIGALYIGAVAIGLAYIPALSYLNIRSSDNGRLRILKLSSSHLCFLIGIASVFTIISIESNDVQIMHEIIGLLLIIPSGIFILLCMINEFRNFKNFTNYKISKDEEININNKNNTLFNDKLPKEINQHTTWTSQLSNLNIIDDNNYVSSLKQILITIVLLIYKCRDSIIFNYILLMYGIKSFLLLAELQYLYWFCWTFVVGALLGCILLLFIGTNILILISTIISMGSLIALIVLFSIEEGNYNFNDMPDVDLISPFLLLFFFGMAMSQCVANINLLQMTKFKYTEIILTCGLIIEITIIFILQHFTRIDSAINNFNNNGYIVLGVLFISCLLLLFIPNIKNYSLIYIRNMILDVKYNTKFYGPGAYLQQSVPTTIQSYGMSMIPQHQLQPSQYQAQFNYNNNNPMSDLNSLNSLNMVGQSQPQYMPEYAQPIKRNKLQQQRPITPTAPQHQQLQEQEPFDYQSLPRNILLPRAYIAPVKMAVELEQKY